MKKYQIESTSGDVYGIYEGETADEAFAAMVSDGGGRVGDPHVGTAGGWIIKEVFE